MLRTAAGLIFMAAVLPAGRAAADTAQMYLGARAIGLGGAYTALADDITAFYWNPAAVSRAPYVRAGVFWGEGFQDRDEMVHRLRSQMPGAGSSLTGDRAWGFATGLTVLGVAVARFTHTRSVLDGAVVRSQGLRTWEVAATLLQSLPPDELVVGINLRYIKAAAFSDAQAASSIPADERTRHDLVDRAVRGEGREESEPGLDLGVVYRPNRWLRLGLAARNLNRPTFHTESDEALSLEPHARVGVAIRIAPELVVAADADVTGREHPMEAGGWRELAMGVEKSWKDETWTVRAGWRSELTDAGLGRPGFSAGIGFSVGGLSLDVAGMTSTRRRLGVLWLGVAFSR